MAIYNVTRGASPWSIAEQVFGDGRRYREIIEYYAQANNLSPWRRGPRIQGLRVLAVVDATQFHRQRRLGHLQFEVFVQGVLQLGLEPVGTVVFLSLFVVHVVKPGARFSACPA